MNKLLHKGSKVIQQDTAQLVPTRREVPDKLGDRYARKIKKCRIRKENSGATHLRVQCGFVFYSIRKT
jgi:hypothetical protein